MAFKDYNLSASLNTLIAGINIGENCLPANVNNALRALMADARAFNDAVGNLGTFAEEYGVTADGTTDDTAALANAISAASGGTLVLPKGTIVATRLTVPSNTTVVGQGVGVTVLKLKASANQNLIVNSDTTSGNTNIRLIGFTVDGNYTNQSSTAHCVSMDKVSTSYFDIECKNARGTGFLLTNGGNNRFGPNMYCRTNGVSVAGYGLYIANSSDNQIWGGRYDDNCIGIAIESLSTGQSRRNIVVSPSCRDNRADFGQSGAGVHFEQSSGNDCNDCILIGPVCEGSTGVGVNNTATNLTWIGGMIRDNAETGAGTTNGSEFLYSGIKFKNNAAGVSNGYRAEMRFDDSGLSPASSGTVIGCLLRGTAPDGGIKTMSANSSVRLIANDVSGYSTNYNLSGTSDVYDRTEQGSYTGTLTGCTTSPTGTIRYSLNGNTVTLTIPAINATSNTTDCTVTGMPAAIRPTAQRSVVGVVTDNGNNLLAWINIETSGTITLRNGVSGTFTGSGLKGIQQQTVTFQL